MDEFSGRTAVVTGASSGIGLGMATRFAAEGMNVVMADIERGRLEEAAKTLPAKQVLAVVTDVSKAESVAALEARARGAFGKVHLLCANAGVVTHGSAWNQTLDDWTWDVGVNLWGPVHCVRSFVPHMLAHGEPAHVVITASAAGLRAFSSSAYSAAKYAAVGLAEGMEPELAGTNVGVSVLCPGGVKTRIFESERNRPAELGQHGTLSPEQQRKVAEFANPNRTDQYSPAEVAGIVLDAVRRKQLFILPLQPHHTEFIRDRMQRVLKALDAAPSKRSK